MTSYVSKVTYPRGGFGDQLKLAMQMLTAPLGVRAAHVVLGGFDTHANQKRQHQTLLTSLAEGITAALDDAEAHDLRRSLRGDDVLLEFGRRVAENGSGGTDHGAGSVMFLAGNPVAGGLIGATPDLAHLDQGDVPCTTDFRGVYASVLSDWLGIKPDPILGPLPKSPSLFRASASTSTRRP